MGETKIIVIPEGKICDYVDGKFRNDTPEEYVRQTVEKRLVNEHKYLPKQSHKRQKNDVIRKECLIFVIS